MRVPEKVGKRQFLSFRRKPWFDRLTTLSKVEGESSYIGWFQLVWTPVFTGVTVF